MRRIILITLVLAGAWMAWWVIGSTALERALAAWIDDRRAEGWAADVGSLNVQGFPNRFDTVLTDLRLADPETGVAWTTDRLHIAQLSYRPNAAVLTWDDTQVLSTPVQTITITADRPQASVSFRPTPSLELDRATLVAPDPALSSTLGWSVDMAELRLSVAGTTEASYRIGAEAVDLTPGDTVTALLDPRRVLPETVERLHLDATLAFTEPWDRFAIEEARPQVTKIDLDDLSARWGEITFRAAGTLTVDAAGVPDGIVTVRAVEWRRLLDMLVSAGLLSPTFLPAIDSTLELMAGMSGNPQTLDADLTFRNGLVSFGPLPLGRAPRLVIR